MKPVGAVRQCSRLGAVSTSVFHTNNVQNYSARWLSALVASGNFSTRRRAILGPDVILHHSKLFQKPKRQRCAVSRCIRIGNGFPTEQDTMIAGVVHVSAATDSMGCFRVYPGSHKLGRQTGLKGIEETEHPLQREYPLEDAMPLEAGPGDVLFFHYLLLHGSKQNVSNKIRKTVLVQLYSGRDRVEAGNTHPNVRLTLRGWNHAATRSTAQMM